MTRQSAPLGDRGAVPPPLEPMVAEGPEKRLGVRFIPDSDQSLLPREEQRTALDPAPLASFGATRRAAERLAAVTEPQRPAAPADAPRDDGTVE